MSERRVELPDEGEEWDALRERLIDQGRDDIDWRNQRTAVYVFHPGEDVLTVAKEAYALYQSENALGPAAFPSLRRMEEEVVSIGLGLMNGPEGATGNITSGGTESILLATKACRDQAAAKGLDVRGARIVVPRTAHLAFDKAAHYLGLEIVRVPVSNDLRADPDAMAEAIDERTILLVGSAPCFPYGLIDPIPALAEIAAARGIWMHVDACVGGYLNPFARMEGVDLEDWDFSVEGVCSISADLHKYGYAAKGASTVLHRSAEQHAFQTFQGDAWPAGGMTTPTVAGTRPGGAIASAWAVLHYLGRKGYRAKTARILAARERLEAGLGRLGLRVFGRPKLGLIAFGAEDGDELPIFAVWKGMHDEGWFSGVVQDPNGIHLMLSPSHDGAMDLYLEHLETAVRAARGGAAGPAGPVRYA